MKTIKIMRFKLVFGFLAALLLLGGCGAKTGFQKGDIKDDFCGAHISAQYCKCAFHNDFCDAIGMKKGEANKYVNEQYDKWVESEFADFKSDCRTGNGIIKGKSCLECGLDEVARDDECVAAEDTELSSDAEADDAMANEEDGDCKYDSDCDPICEGDVAWKMGCNPRLNACEKTFDTDCRADAETFGQLDFPKVCAGGVCIRDTGGINAVRADLMKEKKLWSDTVKEINGARADINAAMLEANKNCINGIADMTNVAIVEFSTRIASVLAGGIPDVAVMTASAAEKASGLLSDHVKNLAGAAVDYAGEAVNRLNNYQQGEPAEEEKKLKPHEYIKLNCDLYEYFKAVLAESDTDLETALANAAEADTLLNALTGL